VRSRAARAGNLSLPLTLLLLAAAFDVVADARLMIEVLYLLPVAMVASSSSRRVSIAAAVFAAVTAFVVDVAEVDYAVSRVDLWSLGARLIVYGLVVSFVVRPGRAVEHERELARTDFVTGVNNSRAFYDTASRLLASSRRQVTLVYVDLDDFKEINDARGPHVRRQRPPSGRPCSATGTRR
jgi:GGDEF domain-containing protein